MHNQLLKDALEKAKIDIGRKQITPLANYLSDIIYDFSGESFGERQIRNLIHSVENNKIITLKPFVANALANYLGYENQKKFKIATQQHSTITLKNKISKQLWIFIPVILIITISILLIYNQNKQHWMIWKNNQFLPTDFNKKYYQLNLLKPYDNYLINHFKQIENPDCNTIFFDNQGNPLLWYYKTKKGEIELYTNHGLHPINNKPLKPITKYMIKKYICDSI